MSKKAEITQEEIPSPAHDFCLGCSLRFDMKPLNNFRQRVMRRIMQKARQWGKLYLEAHRVE